MRVRTLWAGGSDVVVREWGPSHARPLVFWHGLNPFGALQLNEAGPLWAGRGLRVLSIAAPGIADSPPLPSLEAYRPSRLADLVLRIADSLELDRFAYVGCSWGASIGVHLATRHAARLEALVMLDAGHTDISGDPHKSLKDLLAEARDRPERYRFESWEAFFEDARESRPAWRPALEEQLRAGMREEDGMVVARPTAAPPFPRGTGSCRSSRAPLTQRSAGSISRRS